MEKGTECGAVGFALLACARSQKAHVSALSSSARLERLRRIAVEATKQCDRTIVPFVEGPKRMGIFLEGGKRDRFVPSHRRRPIGEPRGWTGRCPLDARACCLSEASSRAKERGLRPDEIANRRGPGPLLGAEAAAVVIGPEGGFAPAEISFSKKNPAVLLSLGPRILRLETAVVVALARLVDPA